MEAIDLGILSLYFIALLAVGMYFSRQHKDHDDYFLGGRNIKPWHVGLSVVATDVGGGFSIGLGGLGFTIGLSGSWMLFTGLCGAWLSAVFLIPKIKKLEKTKRFSTFNDIISHFYGDKVALVATFISLIGYIGFTSSQLLAGAKLTSAAFPEISLSAALWIMGAIAVVYTAFGGLKAVIYTDTIQWMILIGGLVFVGIPLAYTYVGGWEVISATLPASYFSLSSISMDQILEWTLTIIPVWFIGLTLYQRIYACAGEKEAKKAWFIAGILEWPVMALMGTALGLLARVAFETNLFAAIGFPTGSNLDTEMALPLLLKQSLVPGLLGLVLAAYFSAILSTADSCLMAASGSAVSDLFLKFSKKKNLNLVRLSQYMTFCLGLFALILSSQFENVLNLMLLSYGVMVSGLFIPIVGALMFNDLTRAQGMLSILLGGGVMLAGHITGFTHLPIQWGLAASVMGFIGGRFIPGLKPAFKT
ncbi:MAG: sodium:solute symporter [Bacteriovoracia bacterium]